MNCAIGYTGNKKIIGGTEMKNKKYFVYMEPKGRHEGAGYYMTFANAIDFAQEVWNRGTQEIVCVSDDSYNPEIIIWKNGKKVM